MSPSLPRLPTGTAHGSLRLVAALVVLFALSWLHQNAHDFENDDAYISYRYACNWADGRGPVFNAGERVEGYSNFLLVTLLAGVHRLGGDVVTFSRTLGTLSLWGLILLVFLMLQRILRRSAWLALAGAFIVTLQASLAVWGRSGMETVPQACLVFLAQFTFLRERSSERSYWLSGLIWAGVALMRSDGFVHVGATLLFCGFSRRDRRRAWTLLVPFLAVFLPYFLWRWQYYGFFFPNPYYLRTGGDLFQQLRGLFYVHNYLNAFGGLLAFSLPLLLVVFRDPARDAARLYLGTCVVVFGLYVVWVGGDYMPMGRFFVPIVAPLAILQIEAAIELTRPLSNPRQRHAALTLLVLALAFSGFMPTLNRRRQPLNRAILAHTQVQQWAMAGRWLRSHAPPNAVLAAEPVGALGFYSGLAIIDMLGVNDVHIAHLQPASMGHSTAGHEKRDLDYVLSRQPDLVFLGVSPDCAGDSLSLTGSEASLYHVRCVPLGTGPVTDGFGTVWEARLSLRLEERRALDSARPDSSEPPE